MSTKYKLQIIDNVVFATLVALAFSILLFNFNVQADNQRIDPSLALARICVSEAGWDCFNTGDGIAIHEVLLRGAERNQVRYTTFARAYAGRVMGARPHQQPRLMWVMGLRKDGAEPQHWPEPPHASWGVYRQRWLTVSERATEVSAWTLEDIGEWGVCMDAVHDWGGVMDRARAERIGLIPVNCEGTSNDFYARPSLVSDRD